MSDTTIYGMDEFEKSLLRLVQTRFPEEVEKKILQIAYELLGNIKERTPVKTGDLKRKFEVGELKKVNGEYIIEVGTNVEYAMPVENGFKTPSGGFKEGIHMVEVSVKELESRLPNDLSQWLQTLLGEFRL